MQRKNSFKSNDIAIHEMHKTETTATSEINKTNENSFQLERGKRKSWKNKAGDVQKKGPWRVAQWLLLLSQRLALTLTLAPAPLSPWRRRLLRIFRYLFFFFEAFFFPGRLILRAPFLVSAIFHLHLLQFFHLFFFPFFLPGPAYDGERKIKIQKKKKRKRGSRRSQEPS